MYNNILKIGNLQPKLPIIQGGMGIGVSLSKLAGTVAKYGGIGVISGAQPGFLEKDFNTNTLAANLRALKNHIIKAKEISKNGIIGVNLMVAMNNYKEFVEATIEAGADIIISGAGLPLNLPEYIGTSSIKIIPIVSSAKATKIILNYWKKHYNKIPDGIIIEGPEAGGHLGFKADSIEKSIDTFKDITLEIKNVVSEFNKANNVTIPIIVGGGVFTKADIDEYLSLGFNGVQIGSRFVATHECDAHIDFKLKYIGASESDIKIIQSPVGLPGRAIKNDFIEKISSNTIPVTKCYNCLSHCNPATTPYCITKALITSVTGDVDNGLIFCGSKTHKINKLVHVKDLLDELFY